MKTRIVISIYIVTLMSLVSCNVSRYFHHESVPSWPHGDSDYIEINSDGTYEQFVFQSNVNHSFCHNYTGRYYQNGDTLIVTGNSWDYDYNDSLWFISDSTVEICRYLKAKNGMIQSSYLSIGEFDTTSLSYERGKSQRLRKIEKIDSLTWYNEGYLRKPFGGLYIHHGIKEHSVNCDTINSANF